MKNLTRGISPIALDLECPWHWRLIFMLLFIVSGTIGNVFFVPTIYASPELKKKGHIFLACLGFTDMMITSIVGPSAFIALVAQFDECSALCKILQFLTQSSTYCYSVFYMLVAWDMHARLVGGWCRYREFVKYPLCPLAALTFTVSLMTAGIGSYFDLDYDYCKREHFGHYWFRFCTSTTFYAIPFLLTMFLLLDTIFVMKNRVVSLAQVQRYQRFLMDKELGRLHLGCYIFFVTAWTPYLILVNMYPDAPDATYYYMAWIGLVRSALTSYMYIILDPNFRYQALIWAYSYCCCEGPIPDILIGRHLTDLAPSTNGVRAELRTPHVM